MKPIVSGQIANLPISYEVKVEDGALKISAMADFAGLIDIGEKALPEGSMKPFEVMMLEMVKQAVKSL